MTVAVVVAVVGATKIVERLGLPLVVAFVGVTEAVEMLTTPAIFAVSGIIVALETEAKPVVVSVDGVTVIEDGGTGPMTDASAKGIVTIRVKSMKAIPRASFIIGTRFLFVMRPLSIASLTN